jgi:hypothetical protein
MLIGGTTFVGALIGISIMEYWGLYVVMNQSSQLMWVKREGDFIIIEFIPRHQEIGAFDCYYYYFFNVHIDTNHIEELWEGKAINHNHIHNQSTIILVGGHYLYGHPHCHRDHDILGIMCCIVQSSQAIWERGAMFLRF